MPILLLTRPLPPQPGDEMSSRPILLLGATTPVRGRIHEILVAAGYRVLIADSPADALRLAVAQAPRVVVAPVDAAEEWRGLVRAVGEHSEPALPVLIVGRDSVGVASPSVVAHPVSCREPGFGRQLLEEILYVERTLRPAPAVAGRRGARVGMLPLSPLHAASR